MELWDSRRMDWVPERPARSIRRTWQNVTVGGIAVAVLFALLLLAPLERGLFFADARFPFEVLVAMLAAATAVDRALRGEGLAWNRPMDWAVGAYAAGYGAALLRGPASPNAAVNAAFLGLALLLWYWSAAHLLRGPTRIRQFAQVVFGGGLLLALLGLLAAMGLFRFPYAVLGTQRILSTLQYPNALAAALIVSMGAGFGLLREAHRTTPSRRRQWVLAGYGAGLTVLTIVLIGTYSRGGWLAFLVAAALWFAGVPRAERLGAAITAGWPVLAGLIMSRGVLAPFHNAGTHLLGAAGSEAAALLAAALLGAAGAPAYRWVRRTVRRQRWTPAVRRALAVAGAAYGAIALVGLGVLAHHNAVRSGEGLLGAVFAHRVGSIASAAGGAQPRWTFITDAFRLIGRRPVLGFGGGGWAALYHEVQSAPYAANLVHASIPQAWVGGGLLAAAGLAALGGLVVLQGWRLRSDAGAGPLFWGLAAGAAGLWGHALLDFDLSLPALAFLLWAVAATLREAPAGAPAPASVGRARAALGLLTVGACSVFLLLYAQRVGLAERLANFSAVAMEDGQYAEAYITGARAARLDPLSASTVADQAELLAAAYSVNGVAAERGAALRSAATALALDPGSLPANETAVNVAADLGEWADVRSWSARVVGRFPLIGSAYVDPAAALLRAGEAQVEAGDPSAARADLALVAGFPGRYAADVSRLARGPLPTHGTGLTSTTLLQVGEADLLLGNRTAAEALLGPLAQGGNGPAVGWLSAADARAGQKALAAALLSRVQGTAAAQAGVSAQAAAAFLGMAAQQGL